MAEAKKATKTTKSAPKKEAAVVRDLKAVQKELQAKRDDYHAHQKSHHAGELVNPRVLTHVRKDIARLMTEISKLKKESK